MKRPRNLGFKNRPGHCLWLIMLLIFMPAKGFGSDSLRFGVLPVVGTLPLLVGQEDGNFSDQGIDLELISFNSALEINAALQAKKIDGFFGDIFNALLLIQSGEPIKIINASSHTQPEHRSFGIVASPKSGIKTLEQLKDKDVAISRATIIEYMLDELLTSLDLSSDYVTKQEIKKIPIRLQLLLSSKISAAVLPEPLLTLTESKGAHVLTDDRHLEACLTILTMNTNRLAQTPTLAKRFLKAYADAVSKINQKPEAFKEIMVKRTRFPMPVKDLYKVPDFPEPALPTKEDITAKQNWLMKNGLLKKEIPYDRVVFQEIRE